MTLFEIQAWLGHRSPAKTQHYAQITSTTLSRAYADAGYFARHVRVIEVLLNREAIETGAAATGRPWQFFDLGHGHCTYSFFEQCPHRMACARCDFYVPPASSSRREAAYRRCSARSRSPTTGGPRSRMARRRSRASWTAWPTFPPLPDRRPASSRRSGDSSRSSTPPESDPQVRGLDTVIPKNDEASSSTSVLPTGSLRTACTTAPRATHSSS